ncbi:hypothetical protein PCANC_28360 [Puccinia coronata f. sp. avenae]|uniref:Uncharacterized protein n=1 Tax=Puccinia coronata f. sp. avenae TaxID=200324 RepID=A0A2N5RUI2_9BASI|nr:hypothetical protein PCANC_28360 [Puccinia coronata f. sp. avenae]
MSPEQASLLFASRSLPCSTSSEQASLLGKFGAGQPALCKQVIDLLFASRLVACSASSEQAGLLAHPASSQQAVLNLVQGTFSPCCGMWRSSRVRWANVET